MILILSCSANAQYSGNYAGNFNGTSSYLAVPNNTELDPLGAITLEAWINPTSIGSVLMTVIGKNTSTSYFLGIGTSGRVFFGPRGGVTFKSRAGSSIPTGVWTHIAGTYDGIVTSIYINGQLDTSTTSITGSIGVNSDSLYIGADRSGTTPFFFFKGQLDNVRIWGTAKYPETIYDQEFQPLEIYDPTGLFTNLKASFQFDNDGSSTSGVINDNGFPRNLTYINYSDKAVNYMDYNGSLVLNGTTDYFTYANNFAFNATTALTIEAWVRRDTTGAWPPIQHIVNKSGSSKMDYALGLNGSDGSIRFSINSPGGPLGFNSAPAIKDGQWHHIAASYNSDSGTVKIYLNGNLLSGTIFAGHPVINNNFGNLYIGGTGFSAETMYKFKGQIDAVRIWKYERTPTSVKALMFRDVTLEQDLACFDFDKLTNVVRLFGPVPMSNLFAGLAHISSSHLNYNKELTSPVLSSAIMSKFLTNQKSFFVPDGSPTGINDSIFISSNTIITNFKVCVLMSHRFISDMKIQLTSPAGTTITLFDRKGQSGNDMMTVFSDDADSVAAQTDYAYGSGIVPPFSPGIKPEQPLSAFNGTNAGGWWKMKFIDNLITNPGYVHSWGVDYTGIDSKSIQLSALIQGFYNKATHKMVKDTVQVLLRNSGAPYDIIDSSKSMLDSLGNGLFPFGFIPTSRSFYIIVKHRNSIDTWSRFSTSFGSGILNFDFTQDAFNAFGSNQILADSTPVKFAIYNGDVNRDGFIDLTDITNVYNNSNNFVTGYVNSDVTGNNVTDLTDVLLTYNNSVKFVKVIKP